MDFISFLPQCHSQTSLRNQCLPLLERKRHSFVPCTKLLDPVIQSLPLTNWAWSNVLFETTWVCQNVLLAGFCRLEPSCSAWCGLGSVASYYFFFLLHASKKIDASTEFCACLPSTFRIWILSRHQSPRWNPFFSPPPLVMYWEAPTLPQRQTAGQRSRNMNG